MKLVSLGKSVEGRDIWMAVVSSPQNLAKLDHYVDIDKRLALAKGLDDAQAHALAKEGKAMVWIDGGLHASEVSSRPEPDPDRLRDGLEERSGDPADFLANDITLFVLPNPDGQQLVADCEEAGAARPSRTSRRARWATCR